MRKYHEQYRHKPIFSTKTATKMQKNHHKQHDEKSAQEKPTSTEEKSEANISYRQEVFRKLIHLCSLSIPVIYAFIDRQTALLLLFVVFTPFFAGDISRRFIPSLDNLVRKFFGGMMRPHELDNKRFLLNGATYVLISALLCVFLFPKIIAITAFTILIVSDISSALVGRKFGKTPFLDKSLQGTMAFWVSGWCAIAVIFVLSRASWHYAAIGVVATFVGGIVEAASNRLHVDDNFSIPLSVGAVMWLLVLGLEPSVREGVLVLLV
jgi:dolichol kinase